LGIASIAVDVMVRSVDRSLEEPPVSRVQLALNVTDLDAAIAFYGALFDAEPAKVRPGYANFAIAEPPLKLVLLEGAAGGTLNHLGVEVGGTDEVEAATRRLVAHGLPIDERRDEACCYATQDKVWVADADGARWEVYTVLGDADQLASDAETRSETGPGVPADAACCA
jgi:catechol 2,3-dioxygenase-like lactoylglutathione lyase family enzyme